LATPIAFGCEMLEPLEWRTVHSAPLKHFARGA
jgi:hypothetical protein